MTCLVRRWLSTPVTSPVRRAALLSVTALALVATLSGCGSILDQVLGQAPPPAQRDEPGGEVTASADADVFTLALGDCLDYRAVEEQTELTTLPIVPCADEHDSEVYAEKTLTQEEFDDLDTVAAEYCYDEFALFVGVPLEESELTYSYFFPTPTSWEQGDDVLQCLVITPDGKPTTGTLEGAAR